MEPNAIQVRSGVAHVLKCECGAVITLSVIKPSSAPYENEVNDSLSINNIKMLSEEELAKVVGIAKAKLIITHLEKESQKQSESEDE